MAPCFGWDIKNYQQTLLLHLGSSTKWHHPCMATGRCYTGVPHFDGIDFDVLLTFNGSFVTKGNDIIFKNPINEHDKYQIISNLKQMNRAIAISNEHMIVTNGTDPDLEQYFAFGSEKLKIADNFDEISRTDIYQIMCSCKKMSTHRFYPARPTHR